MHSTHFNKPAFFIPGPTIIALAIAVKPGKYICTCSGKDLLAFKSVYPDIDVGEYSELLKQQEQQYITAPQRIDRESFIEALEVLPPLDWTTRNATMTFKSSEFYSGQITAVYARLDGMHYSFRDVASIQHEAIIEKVKASLSIERQSKH